MKTKAIIFGIVVAAVSVVTVSKSQAQSVEQPAVKILTTAQQDIIRLIYAYDGDQSTEINFIDKDGVVVTDLVSGKGLNHGFSKKYNVQKLRGTAFWVEVNSQELSVTYKMVPAKAGKWTAQLEKVIYNYPTLASN